MNKQKVLLWMVTCLFFVGVLSYMPQIEAQAIGNYNLIENMSTKTTKAGKWVKDSKGARYRYTASKKYAKKGWRKIKNKIYYLGKKGYRVTGIKSYKSNYYYLNKNGVLKTGWITYEGYRYYFDQESGDAKFGWQIIDGKTYYFDAKGRVQVNLPTVKSKTIFVGDSRMVGMKTTVPGSDLYIAKVNQGYSWLVGAASLKLEKQLQLYPESKVIMALGVNDLGNVDAYIAKYKELMQNYPEADFYFVSVNPVEKKLLKKCGYNVKLVNNTSISAFNQKLIANFGDHYIDTYTYLMNNSYFKSKGKGTVDGIHYTATVYQAIYDLIKKSI